MPSPFSSMLSKSSPRALAVAAFSLEFAWLLSFLFEGQVLYGLAGHFHARPDAYILAAILAHFFGLFCCGFFVHSPRAARNVSLGGLLVCFLSSLSFYAAPSPLWLAGTICGAIGAGCAVSCWGVFLKNFTPEKDRIKSCADGLIGSNILMIGINVVAIYLSPFAGLTLATACLCVGMMLTWRLPVECGTWRSIRHESGALKHSLALLVLFVIIITINSGLMYQVIKPAFEHLSGLVSWYWAVPYIVALIFMRNLSSRFQRATILFLGVAMIMGAFLGFMLLGRSGGDYLIINTLMLGACGIFDLFWWSILGTMLDHAENPVSVFGMGLSANVCGVLLGDVLGLSAHAFSLAEIAVIALTVNCITLILLPPLNRQLAVLLKSHVYLPQQTHLPMDIRDRIAPPIPDSLTSREKEVLELVISGKSNREIAESLCISESTTKTHVYNIFSKYGVKSRAKLIAEVLAGQPDSQCGLMP